MVEPTSPAHYSRRSANGHRRGSDGSTGGPHTWSVLLVDAANVIGSRPDGWWRDRPGAARAFVGHVRVAVGAGRIVAPVVVVLEGAARAGVGAGTAGGVTVVHTSGSGDDALLDVVTGAAGQVTLVSADRGLCRRAGALGAAVERPGWLLRLLDG